MPKVSTTISDFMLWLTGPASIFLALVMVAIAYFCLRKTNEFSKDAIENTAASVVVFAMNYGAAILFQKDINGFAQSAYSLLGIPTLAQNFWAGHLFWVGMVVAVVALDFCDYIIHRLMHTKWVWPAHAAHHSDTFVNAFSTYRVHFIEPVLMMVNYLVVLTWMQLPQLIPVVILLRVVHNMYIHTDLPWDHGPFKYLIASPIFHRWHHADVPEAQGKNLANIIPAFDLMFGTYYVPGPCQEKMGALASGIEDKNPVLIWIYPFQQWARLIRQSLAKLTSAKQHGASNAASLPQQSHDA